MTDIRCKVDILKKGEIRVTDAEGFDLKKLNNEEARTMIVSALNEKKDNQIEVSPISTYLKANSGVIIINGVAYYVP